MSTKKLFVLGLDCVPPKLLFEEFRQHLPNFSRLMVQGFNSPLRSCLPPITVPAWSVMFSGEDPGELGMYGFRNRKNGSYHEFDIAGSGCVKTTRIWDRLSQSGRKVVLHGVPQTYPPPPINGICVSGFLSPKVTTYPANITDEINRVCPDYQVDVADFRTDDKEALLERIYQYSRNHYRVTRYLLSGSWDLFIDVNMGPDRLHHGFWPRKDILLAYYVYLDQELGSILDLLSEDTAVLVVSDHGAKEMRGGFLINEWLIKGGYLVLNKYPAEPARLQELSVNWEKTTAWAWGGYYSRVFINLKGREHHGVVEPTSFSKVRQDLSAKLRGICGPNGQHWQNLILTPEEAYPAVNGNPPDLMAFFDDLNWRPLASVGYNSLYTQGNDTGSDGAVHDWEGVVLGKGISRPASIYKIYDLIRDFFYFDFAQ